VLPKTNLLKELVTDLQTKYNNLKKERDEQLASTSNHKNIKALEAEITKLKVGLMTLELIVAEILFNIERNKSRTGRQSFSLPKS